MKKNDSVSFNSVDDMIAYFDEKEKKRSLIQKIWEYFYFPVYRFFIFIFEIPRKVKWFIQRGVRGYSECDVWNGGNYILKIMKELIKSLKNNHMGYPCDLTDKKWTSILSEMEKGFEKGLKFWEGMEEVSDEKGKFKDFRSFTQEEMDKFKLEYKKGMKLFEKYIFNLWD